MQISNHLSCKELLPRSYTSTSKSARLRCRRRLKPIEASLNLNYRTCTPDDVPAVAALCGEAFGSGNFPGIDSSALHDLEKQYAVAVEREIMAKLPQALRRKAQSGLEHREYRLRRRMIQMRALLSELKGEPAVYPVTEGPSELRTILNWKKGRLFRCILAIDPDRENTTAGCVSISLLRAEAALPPPFPSSSPLRCYISNMAVSEKYRRKGLALSLLNECERTGRLWGYDSVWLHVGVMNTAAQALYRKAGFKVVNEGFALAGPLRQILLSKDLTTDSVVAADFRIRSKSDESSSSDSREVSSSSRSDSREVSSSSSDSTGGSSCSASSGGAACGPATEMQGRGNNALFEEAVDPTTSQSATATLVASEAPVGSILVAPVSTVDETSSLLLSGSKSCMQSSILAQGDNAGELSESISITAGVDLSNIELRNKSAAERTFKWELAGEGKALASKS
ncbi:hypothetical protein CEUSTIGMA_g6155.t1 [Chlamydomonas eustigma]|uniref:N-acetyltransferase domain-containing protein n=1 Tax=Chlamydomonas eustigma TaxID=1157962 RepID=A0A250X6M2_9CHLO|nr:hypothetical protein CEUSTIGMA_g6155.t1 [Chlamydomonas eustigma]|eukprot:GAX78717.1 hypothetical protein CEUSTIGMA_g6155.t1 [Chlamydomonas eustigma]